MVLVLLGRLAIGAHHTLDVVGSLLIAAASLGLGVVLGDAWAAKSGRTGPPFFQG